MYKTVLVPLDRSEQAEAALSPAATFARRFGAKIDLIVASPVDLDAEEHERYLEKVAVRLDAPIGKLEVLVGDGAATTIIDALRSRPDALLCMSTHGRSGISQAVLGSITEAVVRDAGVPVLLVGPEVPKDLTPSFEAIQVCLDGSEAAGQLIPFAAEWATALGAQLWLVEAQSPDNQMAAGQDIVESGYLAVEGERLRKQGIDAEWEVLHSKDASNALVRFQEQQPVSLIMIATHGRTGLRRMAFGSVAMQVTRHAKSPVLIYHPKGSA